ncbi:CvpA family protein [Candidatus Liberibacter africanus]|uniref:Colicin V production protein n=1 Tax=Candidatus Liberibacter africanus PTSAPSY TaxID=1277257 RepID=A0A0G3I875_LIBAF|nr:CvpA family protein [Candidatus Liberibacter africanus]AKK19902.1 colicin V production protein [Candidatus Liberibacter africanus PTSAPSY]QTP63751.1 CvpA family protein [Candidatus Liberibacter africanus]
MEITYFDIGCFIFIFISSILAMARGILNELISLTNWILAAIMTRFLYPTLLGKVSGIMKNKQIEMIATIVPLFLFILIAVSVLLNIISKPIRIRSVLLDKILGCFFGGIRGIFLLVIAVSCWNLTVYDGTEPEWIKKSISKKYLDHMEKQFKSIIQ